MMHQLYRLCMVKEIVFLLSLQLMYSYLNELTLYAGVLFWPHIDITPLGCSVICTALFLQQRCFWDRIHIMAQVSITKLACRVNIGLISSIIQSSCTQLCIHHTLIVTSTPLHAHKQLPSIL